jgi:protein disulfide-isomerase A1
VSVQKSEKDSNILSFDCSASPKVCDEYGVASFPSIRLFHGDGSVDRYRGLRRSSSLVILCIKESSRLPLTNGRRIVPFLRRSTRPVLSHVNSSNVTTFLASDDVTFVLYLTKGDSVTHDRFAELARQYHDRFAFAVGSAGQGKPSNLECVNNPDSEKHASNDLSTVEVLESFIKQCSTPIIVELTRRNELEYLNVSRSSYLFCIY